MDGAKMFKGIIVGVMVFILALVVSLKEATADEVTDGCTTVANVTMTIGEMRDNGLPLELVVDGLVNVGLDREAAATYVVFVYSNPELSKERIGTYFYQFCIANSGELS